MHSRSVVKIFLEWLLRKSGWWIANPWKRSHDDRRSATWICSSFPTMIYYCSDLHEAFTVFQTKVHLKSSITLSIMKSRKEKMILQYISPQMSRWADILVKLLSKMKEFAYSSWSSWRGLPYWKKKRWLPGWEGALICIDLWIVIFQFEKKMVQDEQFPFQFEKWIEISDRQRFLIVVNMRNGPFWRLM